MLKLIVLAVVVVFGGLTGVAAFRSDSRSVEPQSVPVQALAAPGEQAIEITETELSARLNEQLAGQQLGSTPLGPATLQGISTQLRSGVLQATGDAHVGSTSVPVTMTGGIHVDGGRPIVIVDDLRAGGVPLPASARGPVQQAVQAQVDAEVQRLRLRVTSVTIGDGKLRLIGSPQ